MGFRGKFVPVSLVGLSLAAALTVAYFPLNLAAGALAAVVLLVLTLYRPIWGLMALCVLIPVEGIAVSSRGITEIRLAGMGVFAAWVIHMLIYGKPLRVNQTFWAAAGFVARAGISFLWANDLDFAAPRYGTLVQLLLMFLMTINIIESERDFRLVMGSLLLGAVGSTGLSIHLFVANVFERARAFEAQNPNAYAIAVALAIIAGIYLAASLKNRWLKLLSALAAVYLSFPLLLAQSRSAWLGMAAALAVFLWHSKKRLRNMLIIAVAVAATVTGAFSLGLVKVTLIQRTSEMVSLVRQDSRRSDIWRVAVNVFLDHPVAGVGFMQFPRVYNRYRYTTQGIKRDMVPTRDPHSIYFGVAAELGIIGLALLGMLFWKAWPRAGLPPGANPWISLVLLVFILTSSIGLAQMGEKSFWLVLALAVTAQSLPRDRMGDNREPE